MNSLAMHMQSEKSIKLDGRLKLSMYIFKDTDTLGRGGHTLSARVKKLLRLNRQFVVTDGYCLPVSIVIGKAKNDSIDPRKTPAEQEEARLLFRRLTRSKTRKLDEKNQLEEAKKLLVACGLNEDVDAHDVDDLKKISAHLQDYQIVVWHFDNHHQNVVIRDHFNEEAKGFIGVYFENHHYEFFVPHTGPDSLRTTFCHLCCKLIHHKSNNNNEHTKNCKAACQKCGWTSCVPDGKIKVCLECKVTFYSTSCYRLHLEKRSKKALPHCEKYRYCLECCKSVKRTKYACGVEHECGKTMCTICRKSESRDHNCSHGAIDDTERKKALNLQEKWRFFIFDFESITSRLSTLPTSTRADGSEHVPNLVIGSFICDQCWLKDDNHLCRYCGPQLVFTYKDEATEGPVVTQFSKFIQNDTRMKEAFLLAHNGGGYDHSFVLKELAKMNRITPDLLVNGNKIIQASAGVNVGTIKFKDTLNFMPMPLSHMPEAFGLEGIKKGTFPHLYNHPDHYGTRRTGLPPIEYYQPSFLTPKARAALVKWHSEHEDDEFVFDEVLFQYCKDDVDILVKAVKKYLKICSDLFNKWNPIVQTTTLASFVMFVLKFEHFESNVVGYIPETGFPARNNSVFALKYLQWLDSEDPSLKLEHALSKGEKMIVCATRHYYVDGFSESNNTVYEVYGCMYHGCRECFKARSIQSPCRPNSTVEDLYQETMTRQGEIEAAGYVVVPKWECEIKKELAANKEMKQFFVECRHTTQLRPRDSMYGGRTQPFQALVKADDQHTIEYYDYCSLYPWTNIKGAEYPIGQPLVIRTDFKEIVDNQPLPYRGLVFCDVLPPRALEFPVLPYKVRSKLAFPLCRTCAERPPKDEMCPHNEERQRYLTGTWVTEELNEAIEKGYKVLRYHEAWHWPDDKWFRGGFFEKFLVPLLKLKHEASGWPREDMSDEEKKIHIETIFKNDGVSIDEDKVAKNPALRQMCKLFLNSAWGKFAQNPQKTEMKLIDINDGDALFNFINSPCHEPTHLEPWGENHFLAAREPLKESIKTPRFCNIVYGAITTAVARLRLYKAMERIGAKNLIYCDTDSVIFRQRIGEDLLGDLKGDGLGMLTNEVPAGSRITEIVTLAPKVYSYKLEDADANVTYEVKAKGVTLNCISRENISFKSLKKMMRRYLKKRPYKPLIGKKITLTRGNKRPIDAPRSKLIVKKLKPIADKGHVQANGNMVPFGFSTDTTPLVPNYPF